MTWKEAQSECNQLCLQCNHKACPLMNESESVTLEESDEKVRIRLPIYNLVCVLISIVLGLLLISGGLYDLCKYEAATLGCPEDILFLVTGMIVIGFVLTTAVLLIVSLMRYYINLFKSGNEAEE